MLKSRRFERSFFVLLQKQKLVMADNYLEKQYERYETRKAALAKRKSARKRTTAAEQLRRKKDDFYWES